LTYYSIRFRPNSPLLTASHNKRIKKLPEKNAFLMHCKL